MADLSISDAEIEGVERLLLPKGRHFDDEARAVIRRWAHASRLLGHPNYVGTIQSFVDRFLVAPYFMWRYGVSVRPVDDDTFNEMLYRAIRAEGCHELVALIRNHSRRSGGGLTSAE